MLLLSVRVRIAPMDSNHTEAEAAQAVAAEVRAALGRRNIKVAEMARRLGIKQQYLQRRTSGEIAFAVDDLAKLARELGVSMADLMPREVTSPSQSVTGAEPIVASHMVPAQRRKMTIPPASSRPNGRLSVRSAVPSAARHSARVG